MQSRIDFETPENVRISYEIAGPGTRFLAWLIDSILLGGLTFVIGLGLIWIGLSLLVNASSFMAWFEYLMGVLIVLISIGWYFYFGVCEHLMQGRTVGKRQAGIQVVRTDGFSLHPWAIFLRTLFRVIDHLPPLWIVPLVTPKGQRLGDLVAGTIVVVERRPQLGGLREALAAAGPAERRFRFDHAALNKARPQDVHAVEMILQGLPRLSPGEQLALLARLVRPLSARLGVECPAESDWQAFIEDFLAAEYRRQSRKLG